jgi:hypothetical protein
MCVCLKEHVSHNWIYRYLATLLLNTTESAYIVYDIMKLTPTHQKFLFDVYAKYLTIRSTPQCDTVHICEQYALEQQPSLMDPHYLDLQLHKLSTTVYYSKEDAITARIFADFLEYLHERSSKLDECA